MKLFFFPVLTCFGLLFSCANHSGKEKRYHISGTISVEVPDCNSGGLTGKKALGNATYYIKNATFNDPSIIANEQLKCDENGKFKLKLAVGTYTIVHADKLLSYSEFKLKHSSKSTYYKNLDDDCFLNWYKAPDFLLVVKEDMNVDWVVKSRCYTEQNPCIRYTGSYDR